LKQTGGYRCIKIVPKEGGKQGFAEPNRRVKRSSKWKDTHRRGNRVRSGSGCQDV